uniref:Uncharacterized protein n=1 Tax=Brassica oleracea TaxID=3712 RepID=A0A3P6D133_BRAOL|nr:unnamed protein product [Brassica oleracea]
MGHPHPLSRLVGPIPFHPTFLHALASLALYRESLSDSPNRYWLCSATTSSIKIWDLERKSVVDELKVDLKAEAEKCDSGVGTGNQKKVGLLTLSIEIGDVL